MKRLFLIISLLCFALPAAAFWQSRDSNYNISISMGGYVGPGDSSVVTGGAAAVAWYSCARAWTAAYAASGGSFCDVLNQTTTVTCTIVSASNGFPSATLVGTGCAALSPLSSFCSGVTCSVSKAYDQTGNGHAATQGTVASQPTVTVADASFNNLPTMNCGSTGVLTVATVSFAQGNQPANYSAAWISLSSAIQNQLIGSGSGSIFMGHGNASNTAAIYAGTTVTETATDTVAHATQGTINTTSSALNVDGTDYTGLSPGSTNPGTATLTLCRIHGRIAEAGFWNTTAFTATDRGNLFSNQNGANGYNGAF